MFFNMLKDVSLSDLQPGFSDFFYKGVRYALVGRSRYYSLVKCYADDEYYKIESSTIVEIINHSNH